MGMSVKKYRVKLTTEERQELKALVSRGRAAAYRQTHARVLLLSDEGQGGGAIKEEDIVRVLQIGRATVERVRRCWDESGSITGVRSGWMVKGKPTRIQYGAGSDCLVRRRTAGRLGQLDAETVGRRAGRMRDSREH